MVKTEIKGRDLEILISTMQRTSLSFLSEMFSENNFLNYNILIVNQTSKDKILISNYTNIRVINSFEKGLSKSRNLALQNAKSDIVLIADDDLVYEKGFQTIVLNVFNNNPDAGLITFKAKKFKGKAYRNYKQSSHRHTLKSIKGVISWEIALCLKKIKLLNVTFDENFGLGSEFTTAEEYLFARNIIKARVSCYFCNEQIVAHPTFNSGMDLGSDRIVYARAALNYKIYNKLAYLWLIKFVFFLVKNNYIKVEQIQSKFKIGLKGIKTYKRILKEPL